MHRKRGTKFWQTIKQPDYQLGNKRPKHNYVALMGLSNPETKDLNIIMYLWIGLGSIIIISYTGETRFAPTPFDTEHQQWNMRK